jgi:hypothetical protein
MSNGGTGHRWLPSPLTRPALAALRIRKRQSASANNHR